MTTFPASSADEDLVLRLRDNLNEVRRRIAEVVEDPGGVSIVAVTKTFGPEVARAALEVGLDDLGENYVDELEVKRPLVDGRARWHFLGALQSNKIARVAAVADVVSSLSREKEIRRLAREAPGLCVDIQVDLTGASQRNGAAPEDVPLLVRVAREEGLDVRGLMVVASPQRERAREQFARVADLASSLGLRGRSMGMSDDFDLAVAAGSTELRLGRILFGPRTTQGRLA